MVAAECVAVKGQLGPSLGMEMRLHMVPVLVTAAMGDGPRLTAHQAGCRPAHQPVAVPVGQELRSLERVTGVAMALLAALHGKAPSHSGEGLA